MIASKFCLSVSRLDRSKFKTQNETNSSAGEYPQIYNDTSSANNRLFFVEHLWRLSNARTIEMWYTSKVPVKAALLIFAGKTVPLLYRREQDGRTDKDKDTTGAAVTNAVHYKQCRQGKNRDTSDRLRPCRLRPLGSSFGCSAAAVLWAGLSTSPLGSFSSCCRPSARLRRKPSPFVSRPARLSLRIRTISGPGRRAAWYRPTTGTDGTYNQHALDPTCNGTRKNKWGLRLLTITSLTDSQTFQLIKKFSFIIVKKTKISIYLSC